MDLISAVTEVHFGFICLNADGTGFVAELAIDHSILTSPFY